MSNQRNILLLIKELSVQNWRVVLGGKHYKCYPPDKTKEIITISKTPSGPKAMNMIIRDLIKSGFNQEKSIFKK
jgi:hypothetical protein